LSAFVHIWLPLYGLQSQSGLFSTARAVTGGVIRIAMHCDDDDDDDDET